MGGEKLRLVGVSQPSQGNPFLHLHHEPIGAAKEVKRRVKVVEIFCGPEAVEKLLYLVLEEKDRTTLRWRLKGFAEIQLGSYHAAGHTK